MNVRCNKADESCPDRCIHLKPHGAINDSCIDDVGNYQYGKCTEIKQDCGYTGKTETVCVEVVEVCQ